MKKLLSVLFAGAITIGILTSCSRPVNKQEMESYGYKVDWFKPSTEAVSSKVEVPSDWEPDEWVKENLYSVKGKDKLFFKYYDHASYGGAVILKGKKTSPTRYKKTYKDEDGYDKKIILYISEITVEKVYNHGKNVNGKEVKAGDKIAVCEKRGDILYGGDVSIGRSYQNRPKGEYVFYLCYISDKTNADMRDVIDDKDIDTWYIVSAFSTTQPEEEKWREKLRKEVLEKYN